MDFTTMDNEALAAALAEAREKATALFALTEPTIEQVNEAEALVASIGSIEAEQATRAAAVTDAAERFAAAKQTFTVNDGVESSDDTDAEDDAEEEESEEDADAEASTEGDGTDADADESEADAEGTEGGDAGEGDAVTTASAVDHTTAQRVKVTSAARKVGAKTKRPTVAAKPPVTITAAPDVPGFATGSSLDGMEQVTKALLGRVKGFAPFNKRSAEAVASQSGGMPVLNKFGVASFNLDFEDALTASAASDDYGVVRTAIKQRYGNDPETLTAAGWCAPSETVYSFIADYVVDGLVTVPEVNAPRGGINITTGPERSSQGTALDDFGFTQTEAQAEAGDVKTCETIVCPDFEDHRLDAVGYCYKIPLLTQKAYPELITDALRFANVLYAHKTNRRIISDMVALSVAVGYSGYGPSMTDSLEALSILANRERRRWNVGENAVMEVKVPTWAREVYRADMSRRTGLALSDVATDQKINAEFTARRLNVEYVADWQELPSTGNIVLPGDFKVMMFPAGTFVKAVEDVINLSAVYDAASLSVNEYTGVFFEQGILVAKAGYGSSIVTVPINTAGETGAAILQGIGDGQAAGSF
jgi:hypothetical protein